MPANGLYVKRMRSSVPTRNCFRQARQGPYPAAVSTCAGCPYWGDLCVLRTWSQIVGSMGMVRNPVTVSSFAPYRRYSMRLIVRRTSSTPYLAFKKLFVDVVLRFQPLGESIKRAFDLVRGRGGSKLHFFHRGIKVAFGTCYSCLCIVGRPVIGV